MFSNIPKKYDLAREKTSVFVCFLKYQAFIDVLAHQNNKKTRRRVETAGGFGRWSRYAAVLGS
jgi:hypothetical protein